MTCKSCGKELPDNTKFCTACGKDPTAEAVPGTVTPQPPETPAQAKPAKKPLNKKALIGIAAGVVLLLIIIIAATSGGGKGGLKGEWVPASGSDSYESLDFSGSNVTLDTGIGGAMTGKYTYKDNTLTVTVQGFPMEIPLEIAKAGKYDVLLIGGVTYAHPKDVDKVAKSDSAVVSGSPRGSKINLKGEWVSTDGDGDFISIKFSGSKVTFQEEDDGDELDDEIKTYKYKYDWEAGTLTLKFDGDTEEFSMPRLRAAAV